MDFGIFGFVSILVHIAFKTLNPLTTGFESDAYREQSPETIAGFKSGTRWIQIRSVPDLNPVGSGLDFLLILDYNPEPPGFESARFGIQLRSVPDSNPALNGLKSGRFRI